MYDTYLPSTPIILKQIFRAVSRVLLQETVRPRRSQQPGKSPKQCFFFFVFRRIEPVISDVKFVTLLLTCEHFAHIIKNVM